MDLTDRVSIAVGSEAIIFLMLVPCQEQVKKHLFEKKKKMK